MCPRPPAPATNALTLFFSYAHKDESLRNELDKQLSLLKRQGHISTWYDRNINAGTAWAQEIDEHLDSADIILLLISPDFLASDYCYSIEMDRAMQHHEAKAALVIPVILRPTLGWEDAPFGKLQALPTSTKAVTSWPNRDEAFLDVAQGIRNAIKELQAKRSSMLPSSSTTTASSTGPLIPPSSLWNVPFPRNPFFTGREDVLTRLRTMLTSHQRAAITQPQAISGLGGIGKTQTAIEYAYRYRDEYDAVLWAKADSREALSSDFVAIAGALQLAEKEAQDQSLTVNAVKQWLERSTDWLLILDNADDLSIAQAFLPTTGKGHILLTTRARPMGKIAQRVELDTMEPEEGVVLLLRRAGILSPDVPLAAASAVDRAQALRLVAALGGLPLALDQAGAYIEETGSALSRYLELYQTRRQALLRRRSKLPTDHPEPVATTWSLSFQQVEQANPAAAELLRFCAFLHPDTIPEELIAAGAPDLGDVLEPVARDSLQLDEAIAELQRFSLVRRHSDTNTLSVHRLVQAVLKDEMNEHTQQAWAERAVRAVNRGFPYAEVATWPDCQRYLPHALESATLIKQWNMVFAEAARLLQQAGAYLRHRAQYVESEPLIKGALAIYERVRGPDHRLTADSLVYLANLYWNQGKYEQAEPLYQRALAIYEQALGPNHPDTAMTLNNLAILYRNQGKYEQAEPLYQRALAIYERTLGPDHPDMAGTLHNLANLYYVQGKYEQAEPLYRRALTIKEKALGPDHPSTAWQISTGTRARTSKPSPSTSVLWRSGKRRSDRSPRHGDDPQ